MCCWVGFVLAKSIVGMRHLSALVKMQGINVNYDRQSLNKILKKGTLETRLKNY
ncbi:hypothetical protein NIES3804_40850 [Microcystis aeruginosa NIES-3804]|jgi:hypothetical protein|uniref:Uncharacterized protein n=1 Tax=Microcystis aeruginosa NIES-3804 TaxID=2517783 RepID=A0A6H9GPB8_MICAE|nr:hypothetical protein NIES3804_40850 [Microcystis aeruginosa NIES-3804]